MAKRDYERAVLEFRNAAGLLPESAEPVYQVAMAYLSAGNYGSGIASLLRCVALDPRHAGAQLKLEELRAGEEPGDLGADLLAISDRRLKTIFASPPSDRDPYQSTKTPVADLERAFNRNPKNPEIQDHLIHAYLSSRRFAEAERTLDRVLQQNETRRNRAAQISSARQWVTNLIDPKQDATAQPGEETDPVVEEKQAAEKRGKQREEEQHKKREDAHLLVMRAQLYLATIRAREAEQDLVQALALDPHDPRAHYLLSKVHQVHEADFARRQELAEAVELDELWLGARLELAAARTESGAPGAAVDLLNQAPLAQQNDPGLIAARNWALLAMDDRAALRKGVDHGLAIRRTPEFLLQDAYLRLRLKDLAGAQKSLESALKSAPPDLRAVDALSETYWRQKNPVFALATMHSYVDRYPKSAGLQYLYGTWLLRLNRRDDAQAAFRAAVQARPGFLPALERLADLDIAAGHLDLARQTIASISATPGGGSSAELALGVMEERPGGNPESAIAHYRKVLEESPDNITALNNLAYHLTADPSHADEALKLALRLKKLAPRAAAVDDTLGWAYYNTGAYKLATVYLQAALSAQNKPGRGYRLAMAYYKAGARERARATLRDAMKLDPASPDAAAAQQLINGTTSSRK